jgi:hypothetical protein
MLKRSQTEHRHVDFIIHTSFDEDKETTDSGVNEDERHFINTLEILRKFIYGLEHSGIIITVTLSNTKCQQVARWEGACNDLGFYAIQY